MKDTAQQFCYICGEKSQFISDADFSLREAKCPHCGSSQRNSDLAKIIINTFSHNRDISLSEAQHSFTHLKIYEAQSVGPIHNCLKDLPYYICSEFFDDIPKGKRNIDGILCENLQELSFPDDTFDLVITQDVLEHLDDPEKAFFEINRILKPGGYHIFTIPYHESKPTLRRTVIENGKKIYNYPQVYHGDPLREQGALVFTDFGSDMNTMIEKQGFIFECIPCENWYSTSEIPYITGEKEYQIYLKETSSGILLKYFKYNSWIFRTRKKEIQEDKNMLQWTGERYLPYVNPSIIGAEIHYEHLHRYAFTSQYVKGKKVLDLASGEGYGSFLLSENAESVTGIEIDPDAVNHASEVYNKENLRFIQGSIVNIPIEGKKIFDVIVCFEAIEHIKEHEILLQEIKRLIKDDGLLIISTPNKKMHSDVPGHNNPFHVREIYRQDFCDLLKNWFEYVHLLGQSTYAGSSIYPNNVNITNDICGEFIISYEGDHFSFKDDLEKVPLFFIAIASDKALDNTILHKSFLTDISNMEILFFQNQIKQLSSEMDKLQLHYEAMTAQRDERDSQIKHLASEFEKIQLHYKAMTAQRDERDSQIKQLSSEMDKLQLHYEAMTAQRDERDSQIKHLASEMDKLQLHYEAMTAQRDERDSQIKQLSSEFEKIQLHYKAMTAQRDERDSQIKHLSSEFENLSSEFEKIQSHYTAMTAQRDERDSQIKHLSSEMDKLQLHYEAMTAQRDERDSQIKQLSSEMDKLTSSRLIRIVMKINELIDKLRH